MESAAALSEANEEHIGKVLAEASKFVISDGSAHGGEGDTPPV
jgi:hypothetical protein